MIASFIFIFTFLFSTPVLAENTRYDIVATYDDEARQVEGTEEITFVNSGPAPLSTLYLFLYPNLYHQKYPQIDTAFYRKAYPVDFNPGGLDITSIQDVSGKMLSFSYPPHENQILMKITLSKPILPQEKLKFSVRFVTKIPEKWGPFGAYGDLVALQGGWHPYLANFIDGKWKFYDSPQNSQYRIHMTLKKDLRLIGSTPPILERSREKTQTFLLEGDGLPFFSLSVGRNLVTNETTADTVGITYHALMKDQAYAKQVLHLSKAAVAYFLERYGPYPSTRLNLVAAGLHEDLTTPGTNLLYINTRIFKVFTTLKRFHEASLAYGLYRLLWRKKRPDEAWWVIECLALHDSEAFMKDRHGKTFNLEKWLKPVSFIPLIDQILYSENLPLRQVYFNKYFTPAISEDIRFYNNPPSQNPNIFSKLRSLLGEKTMGRVISTYVGQDASDRSAFRAVLSEVSKRDFNWLIDQWLTTPLKNDFKIADIEEKQVNGLYETSIHIKKDGDGIEPLQIVVHEKDGTTTPLVWDGVGRDHRFDLKTRTPIKTVELDPNNLSSDTDRLNNRFPHRWKVLLDDFNLNYDFQTKMVSYRAGLLFQRLYDTKNWVQLRFSQTDTADFINWGYAHRAKKNHIIRTGVTHQTIEEDIQNGQRAEDVTFFTLGYAFVFPDIPLLSASVQELTTTFPSFNVGLSYNQQFNSNVYDNSFVVTLDLRRLFSFSHYHEIGARVFIGQSFGRLLEESRFFLGGANGMRGYTPVVFDGENISLYSLEYRFPLFYETDLNLMGLAHSHTWQGALFTDTGMVSDSHNVFKVDRYRSDVGFGIRFFVDLFGVYPAIVRTDIAIPIASPRDDEQKIHYYLNFGQSF